MFRLHLYRSPKSFRFKDQSTKQKFRYLKSTTDWIEQNLNSQNEMIRELLERVYKLEVELLPKCDSCNRILTKEK